MIVYDQLKPNTENDDFISKLGNTINDSMFSPEKLSGFTTC